MSAETILKALALGEAASTDDVVTIEFAGRTWHVTGFVGTWPKATVLIEGERGIADPLDIASTFLKSACVVLASAGLTGRKGRRLLQELVDEEFSAISAHLTDLKAGRGKPS